MRRPAPRLAPPPCLWCEGSRKVRDNGFDDAGSFCSQHCATEYRRHGSNATRAQIEARVRHVAVQPKGCATVEEFLAAGGTIYTEPGFGART